MTISVQLQVDKPFLVPPITDPVFQEQADQDVEMIFFIVGVFRLAGPFRLVDPHALTVNEILESLKDHQPWKIVNKEAAKRNIRWILTSSPAFDHRGDRHWFMTGMPLVRTKDLFQKWLEKAALDRTDEEIEAHAWLHDLLASSNEAALSYPLPDEAHDPRV